MGWFWVVMQGQGPQLILLDKVHYYKVQTVPEPYGQYGLGKTTVQALFGLSMGPT